MRQNGSPAASPDRVPPLNHRTRPKRTTQISLMQDVLLAGVRKPEAKLSEASIATRAWCEAESLRREILGKGRPKPVEPTNAKPSRTQRRLPSPVLLDDPPAHSPTHTEQGTQP
jgi:hypothetical protein